MKRFRLALAFLTIVISGALFTQYATGEAQENSTVAQVPTDRIPDTEDFERLRRELMDETRSILKDYQYSQNYQQWLSTAYDKQRDLQTKIDNLEGSKPPAPQDLDAKIKVGNDDKKHYQSLLEAAKNAKPYDGNRVKALTETLENIENSIHKLEFEKQNIPEFTKEYEDRKNALISQLEVISKDIEKNQGTQDRIKDDFDKKTQELQETQHLISFLSRRLKRAEQRAAAKRRAVDPADPIARPRQSQRVARFFAQRIWVYSIKQSGCVDIRRRRPRLPTGVIQTA